MKRRSEQNAATLQRGDTAKVVRLRGHRVAVFAGRSAGEPTLGSNTRSGGRAAARKGFTLIELVISITVLTILTLGVVPLVKVAVKRQREQQLRETLRTMRAAIDQFHREAVIYNCNLQGAGGGQPQPQQLPPDPRIKVAITDCTIFGVDNPDRYPPDLETLVNGVNVIPISGMGGRGQPGVNATQVGQLSTKKKVYLRDLPVDPMTGLKEWCVRSSYDSPSESGDCSTGGENVFDVYSKAKGTALNGEKYSDW
jgi:general secretion pathway protein G